VIGDPDAGVATSSQRTVLPLVCTAAWAAAAAGARLLGIWTAIGAAAIALGAAVLVLDGAAVRKIFVPRPWLVLLGAGVGATMAAATYLLYPLFSGVAPFVARDTAILYSAFRAPSPVAVLVAFLPVIVGEELVWRGVEQAALARRFGAYGGAVVAAVAYALAHAPFGSPVLVLAALACGLCWGALRAATGSLVPPLVAHILWDAVILLWLPLVAASPG
jgi:membrane protease YdiL (CAAX protease family)